MIGALEAFVFARRRLILAIFALVTLVLGTAAARLPLEAGFEKQLPLGHPYMETFLRYQDEFGGANRLLIAVRARDGDIFDPHFFETLEKVTDAVFFLPGVNRSSVRSIFTPNVRFVDIVEGGFAGGNVVPAEFRPVPSDIADVRENILKAGLVGRLVAEDFSACLWR
jgi:predicted RND superfamily exporter protein